MAGCGPAPQAQRRRRNQPMRGDWVDLQPLDKPILAPLPRGKWRKETRDAWNAWRRDPVTAQWVAGDVAFALDTIRLHQTMTASSASEVRLRMDALGLTPKGKRDLRFRVGTESAAEPEPAPRRTSSDRRSRLSVVV